MMMPLDNFRKTIHNPMIPHVETIMEGLSPGELVTVRGSVPEKSERFQIDFQCGCSTRPRADIAFHFNPRFKKAGCIVCNTLENERWGYEEITYEMPFEKGKLFEIVFMVLRDKFQVSVNGKHLLLYKHKIHLKKINTLGIYGTVEISMVGFVTNKSLQGSQPFLLGATNTENALQGSQPSLQGATNTGNEELSESLQFVLPYEAQLLSSLEPGRTIVIKGEIKEKTNRFAINLKPSDSRDIALHLNPRMKEKVFVRNSFLFSSWGEEEKHITHFPFSPGMYFEMIVLCKAHQYNVAINGVHTLEYKHRFKQLNKINVLEISGDIELLDVRSW